MPLDGILMFLSYFLAYFIHYDFSIPPLALVTFKKSFLVIIASKLAIFFLYRVYSSIPRYIGMLDLIKTIKANATASLLLIFVGLIVRFDSFNTISLLVTDGIISVLLIGGLRATVRLSFLKAQKKGYLAKTKAIGGPKKRILILGAGEAGEKVVREVRDNPRLNYDILGFLDDETSKIGLSIHGIPVIGMIEEMPDIIRSLKIDEVIIAIPSATGKQMRRIVNLCKTCKVEFRTIPTIDDIVKGRVAISRLRQVTYEDILGRIPVVLDSKTVENFIQGKRILVTGAGGSIGSELCRQIIALNPLCLILCDNSENNLFFVEIDLKREKNLFEIHPVLSDIKNYYQMNYVFKKYRPDVVFHAAAYKHVPMMELNPWEAVHNNVEGTRNILSLCRETYVERFVLVSTDKAVRPSSIMGATKRIAELLTQWFSINSSSTRFMAVRFGNVLGSSGSVIPLFREQIEQGGPVTVTHPEVTRYFMTISEASQLILQAGAMGEGGEIFILDMGTPIKIVDMARDLIELSGLKPDVDIEIKFIGLRPGEKLYEELITADEGIVKTSHEKIMVLKDKNYVDNSLYIKINELVKYASNYDSESIIKKLKEIVPEYNPYNKFLIN